MMRKYTNKPAQGPRGRGLMRMDPNQESGQSSSSGDHKTCSIHIFMKISDEHLGKMLQNSYFIKSCQLF